MSAKFRATCDRCGAISPEYARKCNAAAVAATHDCDRRCAHDGYLLRGPGMRGLCQRCFRRPEIREQYPISFRRRADLIEDMEWLLNDGASLGTILARLDMKIDALWLALKRADRKDLWWRAADREPNAEMRRAVAKTIREKAAAS